MPTTQSSGLFSVNSHMTLACVKLTKNQPAQHRTAVWPGTSSRFWGQGLTKRSPLCSRALLQKSPDISSNDNFIGRNPFPRDLWLAHPFWFLPLLDGTWSARDLRTPDFHVVNLQGAKFPAAHGDYAQIELFLCAPVPQLYSGKGCPACRISEGTRVQRGFWGENPCPSCQSLLWNGLVRGELQSRWGTGKAPFIIHLFIHSLIHPSIHYLYQAGLGIRGKCPKKGISFLASFYLKAVCASSK